MIVYLQKVSGLACDSLSLHLNRMGDRKGQQTSRTFIYYFTYNGLIFALNQAGSVQ